MFGVYDQQSRCHVTRFVLQLALAYGLRPCLFGLFGVRRVIVRFAGGNDGPHVVFLARQTIAWLRSFDPCQHTTDISRVASRGVEPITLLVKDRLAPTVVSLRRPDELGDVLYRFFRPDMDFQLLFLGVEADALQLYSAGGVEIAGLDRLHNASSAVTA